jgi:hypothetical protein
MRLFIFLVLIFFYQIISAEIGSRQVAIVDTCMVNGGYVNREYIDLSDQVPGTQKNHTDEFKPTFEIGINPVLLPFGVFQITGEGVLSRTFGLEGNIILANGLGAFVVNGKYYPSPKQGGDNYYTGAFLITESDFRVGFGFLVGYKKLIFKDFVFDAHLGLGSGFGELAATFKFTFGYRF